ncbi:hypothetical protein ABN034_10405 [Actinopolymorpha sp. B11F2]
MAELGDIGEGEHVAGVERRLAAELDASGAFTHREGHRVADA